MRDLQRARVRKRAVPATARLGRYQFACPDLQPDEGVLNTSTSATSAVSYSEGCETRRSKRHQPLGLFGTALCWSTGAGAGRGR